MATPESDSLVDLDAGLSPWAERIDARLARRGLTTRVRTPVLAIAMLVAVPLLWVSLVTPVLLVSTAIEWLVRNSARLDANKPVAIAIAVGMVAWVALLGGLVGYRLGRRERVTANTAVIDLADDEVDA